MGEKSNNTPASRGQNGFVDAFIHEAREIAGADCRGRLVFALDATMSRQPTWDLAQSIQGEMFAAASAQGGLDVQLVYFRGLAECRASRFVSEGRGLANAMAQISCQGGRTQIGKVLRHAVDAAKASRVGALIYIGDAMEENVDHLCSVAGELGLLGVKAFLFQEGADSAASMAFRELARLTGGAYATFDSGAPRRLRDLLGAAAAYAAGGRAALEKRAQDGQEAARLLLSQMS